MPGGATLLVLMVAAVLVSLGVVILRYASSRRCDDVRPHERRCSAAGCGADNRVDATFCHQCGARL